AAAVLLNARYVPIGISIARGFTGGRARRLAESQLVVDESWAIAVGAGRFDRRVLVGAGLVLYAGWVGGRRSASWAAARWATRTGSGSTPPSPRSSWPSSRRGCARAGPPP